MDEMKLEQELRNFDFSELHPIKEELLERLLNMHRAAHNRRTWQNKMGEDELDLVAAAGQPYARNPRDEENKME